MALDWWLVQNLSSWVAPRPVLSAIAIFFASVLIWFLVLWYVIVFVFHKKSGLKDFWALVLGSGMVYLFNIVISLRWFRPRPFIDFDITPLIHVSAASKSFPSDHAAIAFFLAYLLWQHNKKWWWAFLLAAAVSLGRVMVGVHYPLDAVAGALVGMAFGYLTRQTEKLWQTKTIN